MKTKFTKWIGILIIGLIGCTDNFDNIAIDPFSPTYIFPLINSTITFKELAEKAGTNSVVEQRPGSSMYFLNYRDTIDLGLASNLFPAIPPVTFNDSYQLNAGEFPGIFPTGTVLGPITKSFNQTYSTFPDAELKRIDLIGGTIQFNMTNSYNHSISGNITITSLKDAINAPVVIPFNLSSLGSTSVSTNLNGTYLDLFELPNTYNYIKYSVSATITSSGNPSLAGNIGIELAINNPIYQKIVGKITYSYVHADQPYSIGLFASTIIADQHLAEPKFSLSFVNSFGLPSKVNFTRFEVENNSGAITPITNSGTANPGDLLIGTPNTLKNATVSKPSDTTKLVLTASNSNIENIFDNAPNSLSFGATFNIGDVADPNHNYFITNESKFQLLSEIEIPLKGWVVTNEIADTIPGVEWPDFKKDLKLTNQKFRFKFKFNNGLPLNMFLQIRFLDTNGALVTQLFDAGSEHLIKSSPVDVATGNSTGKTLTYAYITIDEDKYNQMALSNDMVIIFKFTTGGNLYQNITIQSTDAITFQMTLEASGTVKL